jgi:transposase
VACRRTGGHARRRRPFDSPRGRGVGAAQAHHGYLFANARGTRVKLVLHDGFGVWCAARRLNQGRFMWPNATTGALPQLTQAQFDALVLGLPWQRLTQLQTLTHV